MFVLFLILGFFCFGFFFNGRVYCFIAEEEPQVHSTFANICGGRAKYAYTVLIIKLLSACCVHDLVSISVCIPLRLYVVGRIVYILYYA